MATSCVTERKKEKKNYLENHGRNIKCWIRLLKNRITFILYNLEEKEKWKTSN